MSGFRSFLSKKGVNVVVAVGDEQRTIVFYPVSVRRLLGLRNIATALARSVASLEATNKSLDYQRKERTADGVSEVEMSPPTVDVLELRERQRNTAIDQLVACLLDPENVKLTASIIMDCMRDEPSLPRTKDGEFDVDEFLAGTDAEVLLQLVKGVMSSNKRLFDPLTSRLAGKSPAGLRVVKDEEEPAPTPTPDAPSSPD